MNYNFYDFVGNVGVTLIIGIYVLLQTGKIKSGSLIYSLLNAAGASLIIASLYFGNFNFSAFIVEFFWVLISIYGIIKYFLRENQPR